jgi:4-methyl-5(b-hydroxyethyl)-thiazole monophosphate biosynthesis
VATFHPGFADKLTDKSKIEEAVVISDNLVTGRGPGTSIEFGTTLVE